MVNREIIRKSFDLAGCEVTKLEFNYAVRILLEDHGDSISLFIETRMLLQIDGIEKKLDPQTSAVSLSPLLGLLHKPAKSVTFSDNGELKLEMMDGAVLSVFKDEMYESWEAEGTGLFEEISMLCTPHDGAPWNR